MWRKGQIQYLLRYMQGRKPEDAFSQLDIDTGYIY